MENDEQSTEHASQQPAAALTPQGKEWAEAHAATSISARIALHGQGWPDAHRNTAIHVCNEMALRQPAAGGSSEASREYRALLNASADASATVREAERELQQHVPGSAGGQDAYRRLRAAEAAERELRAAVRNHPDHSYDGL